MGLNDESKIHSMLSPKIDLLPMNLAGLGEH